MNAFLFEVRAGDPVIYVGIAALLTAVAVSACWIPARRAARVDPMQALHSA
jgi:ABC-type lipoprotein release transport system permease subunit